MSVKHNIINSTGIKRRYFILGTGSAIASTLIASCSAGQSQSINAASKIKAGVASVIPEDVLKFVQKEVAPSEGLEVEIVKISDWVQFNNALKTGEIDANFGQHKAFMDDSAKRLNLDLVILNRTYLTRFGIYSKRLKLKSLNEIPAGASLGIQNDAGNRDRALKLLQSFGLLKLQDKPNNDLFTVKDVIGNPKNLQIKEVDGPALVRALDDLDIGVVYATALAQAKVELNPIVKDENPDLEKYGVGLVTLRGKENQPNVQKLNQLLVNPKIKDFLNTTYKGAINPAF